MRIIANQIPRELPSNSRITDLLVMIEAKPPYAVAVNLQFVPKTRHAEYILQDNDQVEIIAPVTGG
ncbi:MAG: sulfur carrier protein ThiS [Polynucleobacter sp.]|jgi:sulfur carrier protein|uniref:sulfur carrier protein ThiS n=1 Tax=Polynucleobacter sp. TaxID=2029855 RepID=UPI0027245504|nr:sulfur carrier protein ThiS [Polynucleobacter sp.]MDO9014212.1 sulfur carrier protein ThiS [Polynucleobacter sp.]MDP3121085.1 sulfur carrier protein ThiS [Polynucleobacter sp.]